MGKNPAYIENSEIATKPVQVYGWENAPVRVGADGDALKVSDTSSEEVRVLLDGLTIAIRRLIDANLLPPDMDMASYRKRVTAVLESGTVTTVSSVTNVASIGGYPMHNAAFDSNLTAWTLGCGERIS